MQRPPFDSKGFLVAEKNDEIIGYIEGHLGYWIADGVFKAHNAIGFIERILVHEKYRRKGIGTTLVKSFLEHLKSLGARAVIVDTVTDEKRELAAKGLYKKFGFKEICKWTSKEHGKLKRLIKILV